MSTHLDWFRSNIRERLIDPNAGLKLDLNPYPFREMSFHDAADYTANLIDETHDKIFVSFSGGADSEYVMRTFHRNYIEITPILIETSGNKKELSYAYQCCDDLGYDPVVLHIDDASYLRWYNRITKEVNGIGIYCIPSIVACEYAKNNNGVLIIGEHVLDTDKLSNEIKPGVNEWDFYNELFVGEEHNIPFFNYTVELCYAMVKAMRDVPLHVFKAALYGTKLRPIMDYEFSQEFTAVRNVINRTRKNHPNYTVDLGTKEEFLDALQTRAHLHKDQ